MEENTDIDQPEPFQITSQPYSLKRFYKMYEFPQTVRVFCGYFGVRKEDIIQTGEELLLLFIKRSQVIVASNLSKRRSEQYCIQMNSSLWFVPHEVESHKPANDGGHCMEYKKVEDLLKRKGELPKVVKVCKTSNGKSAQSSVVAGELIFPQKVLKTKKILECLNEKNEVIQLKFACEGNFSVRPMDVKMHIAELVRHFNDFPISVMVISDNVKSNTSFSLPTGTILSLKESKTLRSCIYSTDIFGKENYPLMEMPLSIPIEIQCIEYADLDMRPIYNAIQHTYENFKPSMVKQKNLFTEQGLLYEEIQKDEGTTHIYDLEKPSRIYESIPGQVKDAKIVNNVSSHSTHTPVQDDLEKCRIYESIPDKIKDAKSANNISYHPIHTPVQNSFSFTERPPQPKLPDTVNNPPYENFDSHWAVPSTVTRGTLFAQTSPGNAASHMDSSMKSLAAAKKSVDGVVVTAFRDSKEENLAYLKTLSLDNILQLLDNMNLGEHKKSFEDEQIDGEILVHLDKADLIDLGVIKNIHQTRLLKLMDGTMSAKKYHQSSIRTCYN